MEVDSDDWDFSGQDQEESNFDMVLTNELIMGRIFDFLTIRDLQHARLVNSQWRDMSLRAFQNKAIVRICATSSLDGNHPERFLTDFATTPSGRIVFRRYRLVLWTMDEYSNLFVAFWEKFGPPMEYLELVWIRFVGVEFIRDVMYNLAPNLKQIVFKDCNFYESYNDAERNGFQQFPGRHSVPIEDSVRVNRDLTALKFTGGEAQQAFPLKWEEVFRAYPNLQELAFYNVSDRGTDDVLAVIQTMRQQSPRALQISKLNVFNGDYATSAIPRPIMERLISLDLPLKELNIDIGANVNEILIQKLLQRYSKQLEKLIIYRGPLGDPMKNFPFDVMFPNLLSVELTETVSDVMDFVQFMPNLRKLSLCEPPEVEPPFLPTDMVQKTPLNFPKISYSSNVTDLRVDYDITTFDVKKLVCWFPVVTRARLYLDNEGMRAVAAEWPKLEELEVLGERLTEEGVTGHFVKVVNKMEVPHYNTMNLTRMDRLRKFIMLNYHLSTTLNDRCVDEGFMKLRNLQHLEICSNMITDKGWEKLQSWSQLVTLIPYDGRWDSECKKFGKSLYERKNGAKSGTKRKN